MIVLIGKMKCDASGCTAQTDVEFHVRENRNDEIVLTQDSMPEGWHTVRSWDMDPEHLCPEHSPIRSRR